MPMFPVDKNLFSVIIKEKLKKNNKQLQDADSDWLDD